MLVFVKNLKSANRKTSGMGTVLAIGRLAVVFILSTVVINPILNKGVNSSCDYIEVLLLFAMEKNITKV